GWAAGRVGLMVPPRKAARTGSCPAPYRNRNPPSGAKEIVPRWAQPPSGLKSNLLLWAVEHNAVLIEDVSPHNAFLPAREWLDEGPDPAPVDLGLALVHQGRRAAADHPTGYRGEVGGAEQVEGLAVAVGQHAEVRAGVG